MIKRKMMAIDPSLTSTGVAIFSTAVADGVPELLSVHSIETKYAEDSSRAWKLYFIAQQLEELKEKYHPEIIVYESGFSRFIKATQALYQVQGIMLVVFRDIPMISYAPSSVKKSVAGKGNVKKEVVRDIIARRYPLIEFRNMDETDAIAVGLHHLEVDSVEGYLR